MAKEIIREIKGHRYKYLIYWDKEAKKAKQKYLGRVDKERTINAKKPDEKEVAEAILRLKRKKMNYRAPVKVQRM